MKPSDPVLEEKTNGNPCCAKSTAGIFRTAFMRHAALALRVLQFKLQPGQPQESQTEHGRRSWLGNRTSEPVRVCENVPVNQVDARRPGHDRTEAGIITPPSDIPALPDPIGATGTRRRPGCETTNIGERPIRWRSGRDRRRCRNLKRGCGRAQIILSHRVRDVRLVGALIVQRPRHSKRVRDFFLLNQEVARLR